MAISADSTYKVKIRYQTSTGSDGETEFWLGTIGGTDAYRSQGTATDGTEVEDLRFIDFAPNATIDIVIDGIKVDNEDIAW